MWTISFTLGLFSNPTIELLTDYIMLFSVPFFVIGLISVVLVSIVDRFLEVSEDQVEQLLLNIDEKDFQKGDFTNIKPDNNFIVVNNFNHEINYVEALMLLKIANDKGIVVKLLKQASFTGLDQNPKELFADCMDMLWGASR